MKRILLLALLLALPLMFGCPPGPNSNNSNIGSNANQNANKPTPVGTTTFTKADKAVAILVFEKGGATIAAIPDPIQVKISKNEKVRWSVFNDLDQDIGKIEIDFGANNPLTNGPVYTLGAIAAGDEDTTKTEAKTQAGKTGKFKYEIRVYDTSNHLIVKLDPDVEIAN